MGTQTHSISTPSTWADKVVCWCVRHWLVLLLTTMLLFVIFPFLAPAAMAVGWTGVGDLIYWLYTPFCHQLPQRSWFLFGDKLTYTIDEINYVFPYHDAWNLRRFYGTPVMGWKVAWSDRMISFYTMTPIFGVLYAFLRRADRWVKPMSLRVLFLALMPMSLDAFAHLLNDIVAGDYVSGFRDTNSWLTRLTANAFPGFYTGDQLGTFNWWTRLLTGILAAWGVAFTVFPFFNKIIGEEVQRYCDTGGKITRAPS